MLVNYDIPKIRSALEDFYNATGINMDLYKTDFSTVSNRQQWENTRYCKCVQDTAEGKKACCLSDAELLTLCYETKTVQSHVCHAGLVDVAVPILYEDTVIGYIIFGQMKGDVDFSCVKDYISSLGLDTAAMQAYYSDIPFFNDQKIQSVINIASMLVKHILLDNMLKPDFDESIQKAITFIDENLATPLTVRSIAKATNTSKSVLYKRFHACFQCTLSEYINTKRVDKAAHLLLNTDLSAEEISQKVGYTSTSYFSKTFKKNKGMSPLKFKKSAHQN